MTDTTTPPELQALASAFEKRLRAELGELRRKLSQDNQRPLVDGPDNHTTDPNKPAPLASGPWLASVAEPLKGWTVGDALTHLEADIAVLATDAAQNLRRCAARLVAPELLPDVLRHKDMADKWPWAEQHLLFPGAGEQPENPNRPAWEALHLLRMAADGRDKSSGAFFQWPASVTLLEVATWAAPGLNTISEQSLAAHHKGFPLMVGLGGSTAEQTDTDDAGDWVYYPAGDYILRQARKDAIPHHVRWRDADGGEAYLRGYGMALLYQAERAVRLLRPHGLSYALVAVDKPPVRVIAAMSGADTRNLTHGLAESAEVVTDPSAPTRLEFHWAEPKRLQLELELVPADGGPFAAIAAKYGDHAVRHLLGVYAFTWAARAKADEPLWWWPDEHLWLLDLSPSKENRARLRGWLENMTRTKLTAHYSTGKPLAGPLVSVSLTDGDAYRLHIHPALFRGVTDENGVMGKHWWPLPLALLKKSADRAAGKVHTLAPVLGYMWRGCLRQGRGNELVARVGVDKLAQYLALRKRTDRKRRKDPRASGTLERTLQAGQDCGLVGRWELVGGDMAKLTGNLLIEPGAEALRILNGADLDRPAWLPATGDDLRQWLDHTNMTSAEAAELTGVNANTLRRLCMSHRGRPLPARVRTTLRRALWR